MTRALILIRSDKVLCFIIKFCNVVTNILGKGKRHVKG